MICPTIFKMYGIFRTYAFEWGVYKRQFWLDPVGFGIRKQLERITLKKNYRVASRPFYSF